MWNACQLKMTWPSWRLHKIDDFKCCPLGLGKRSGGISRAKEGQSGGKVDAKERSPPFSTRHSKPLRRFIVTNYQTKENPYPREKVGANFNQIY